MSLQKDRDHIDTRSLNMNFTKDQFMHPDAFLKKKDVLNVYLHFPLDEAQMEFRTKTVQCCLKFTFLIAYHVVALKLLSHAVI